MACGKQKYKSHKDAWKVIYQLIRQNKAAKGSLHAYKCKKCSNKGHKVFHIGHKWHKEKISPRTWDRIKNSY